MLCQLFVDLQGKNENPENIVNKMNTVTKSLNTYPTKVKKNKSG